MYKIINAFSYSVHCVYRLLRPMLHARDLAFARAHGFPRKHVCSPFSVCYPDKPELHSTSDSGYGQNSTNANYCSVCTAGFYGPPLDVEPLGSQVPATHVRAHTGTCGRLCMHVRNMLHPPPCFRVGPSGDAKFWFEPPNSSGVLET